MKKIFSLCIIFILILNMFTILTYADTPIKKLGRGIANIFTSPLEFFKGIQDANNEKGIIASLTWGVIRGTFNTGLRAIVGIYEVVTFPIPLPKGYKPILTDPEFFGEED